MKLNVPDLMNEFTETSHQIMKGMETLRNIAEVKVATSPKTLVWQEDLVKVYRYDRETPATCEIPVLISFAMLNRHDVLDLQPDRSLVQRLLEQGLDIYIMDWGYPTREDMYLTMDDYINGFLNDAVDFVRESHKVQKIHKIGICQGGTFSTIYAALHPEKIQTLTTLVAPFDFSTNDSILFKWTKNLNVDAMVDSLGMIPADMLNNAFGMLKPTMDISKYTGIFSSIHDEDKLMNFLRMEHWKSDCPDLAGEWYRQYIKDLFQDNKLIKGELEIGGHKVDLKNIDMPVLTIYATEDNIIPPDATKPINEAISSKDKELYQFVGGHIGVFVGGRSQKELGPAIGKWIQKRS
ncbi:MAG: class III poly(R)-hydroxyalkanoic acid synthase subunit PhaC [Bacteroidia bacterium]